MSRALLALALLAAPLAGCPGQTAEGPDLAALGAELTVHTEEGACKIPTEVAEGTGLLEAASEAIARIDGVHRRTFGPGQIEQILEGSRYVHVAFPSNTSIELPSYPGADATTFEDLYLIWETSAGVDDVLSNGAEYGTTYPMDQLEQRALAAVDAACPGGAEPGDPGGTYQLAWIHGTERLEPPPEGYGVCDVRFDHGVDAANETLVYRQEGYTFDPGNVSRMVAWDVWERPSSCPLVYRLEPNVVDANQTVGAYGSFNVSFEVNGTLSVDGERWLDPGQNTTISYSEPAEEGEDGRERWRNGTIHVEHFEGWPRSELRAEGG